MHASMVTLSPKEGQLEGMVTKYTQEFLPLLLATPGCQKSYIFADPKNNVVRLLAFWTSEAHAAAPEARSTFQTVVQGLTPYLGDQPVRELFEVRYGE
jgi:quinol monooxygenase YgiN